MANERLRVEGKLSTESAPNMAPNMPRNPAQELAGFCIPVRVYFEDTDSGGIVYYANYLKFMERARTEFLREIGFEQDSLSQHSKRLFVVKNITVNYVKPARFNDLLDVSAQPTGIRPASLSFVQTVHKSDTLLCDAVVQLACLQVDTMKPARIPTEVLEALCP